jgi:transcriptional regulator with XRE-family HTH domain
MIDFKLPKLVGNFIKQRRQALNMSQRTLGQMLNPPVTTQFISNLERGVTPLPVSHIPALAKVLQINDHELTTLLEKEYALKISKRIGKSGIESGAVSTALQVSSEDAALMKAIYDAFRTADQKTQQAFITVCESILGISKLTPAAAPNPSHKPQSSD